MIPVVIIIYFSLIVLNILFPLFSSKREYSEVLSIFLHYIQLVNDVKFPIYSTWKPHNQKSFSNVIIFMVLVIHTFTDILVLLLYAYNF